MCGGVAALGNGVSLVVGACGDINNGWVSLLEVMVSEALTIGRCYGVWHIASCTMVFVAEEERKHLWAYFQLPHRVCPM